MKLPDAHDLVIAMFNAHGSNPAEGVVTQLAIEVANAACSTCAREVLEQARTESKFPLKVPTFLGAFRTRYSDPAHAGHINVTDVEAQVGDLERFWKGPAVDAIFPYTAGDRLKAELIAARMWGSESIFATTYDVAMEFSVVPKGFRHVWLGPLQDETVTSEQVEAAYNVARKIATSGYKSLTDEELTGNVQQKIAETFS